jgi:hypothetical protein
LEKEKTPDLGTSNMTGVTTGAGNAYPSVAPAFIIVFCGVHVAQSLVFCIVFYRSLWLQEKRTYEFNRGVITGAM